MAARPPLGIQRRGALALLGSPMLPAVPAISVPALSVLAAGIISPAVAAAAAAHGVRTDQITVLYRPATQDAPSRLDPAVQTAIRELERLFIASQFRVLQPSAEIYRLMDQGQGVVVTFAADAGFSLIFSAYRDVRPDPRQDGAVAELRLESRVVVGRNILTAEEGVGQMFTRTDPANREYGERKALELAAKKASAQLAEKTVDQLRALTPESISQMLGSTAVVQTDAQVVYVPPAGGVQQPPALVLPPAAPAAPAAAPAQPAAAPVPAGGESPPTGVPPVAPAPAVVPVVPPAPAPLPSPGPAAAPAGPLPPPKQRWALVVGMSNYASVRANGVAGMTDLPGVAKDAATVRNSLAKMGFAADKTTVLRDADATSNAVRDAMKRFAGGVQSDDLVLIFFAAHGGDKEFSSSGFGMPILADYGRRDTSTLDFWEVQSFVRNLKGRVVWISDTCHAGGAANNITSVVVGGSGVQASQDVRGPDALEVAKQAGPGQNFAILTASSPHEISWEVGGGGGLFTSTLFDAMAQAGPEQTLSRVFADRVQRRVVEESKAICARAKACAQHPQQTPMMAFGGAGDRIRL